MIKQHKYAASGAPTVVDMEDLRNFSARLLAADPGNTTQIENLRRELEEMLPSLEKGSPATELLRLGLRALHLIEQQPPEKNDLLDAVASVTATAAQDLDERSDQSLAAIRTGAMLLRKLLNADSFRCSQPATGLESAVTPQEASNTPQTQTDKSQGFLMLAPDADLPLIREFMAESCDRIVAAEAALLVLEKSPGDIEQINTVLRAFHTIKGAAGFLGLGPIEKLAHQAESLLIRARDGEIQIIDDHADLALRCSDVLRGMTEQLADIHPGQSVPVLQNHDELLTLLGHYAEAVSQEAPMDAGWDTYAPDESATSSKDPIFECWNEVQGDRTDTITTQEAASVSYNTVAGFGDTSVRVGTDRLDNLVNMVGELVVAQSIVTQHPDLPTDGRSDLLTAVNSAAKIIRELQGLVMGLRMVPLQKTFQKMTRLVRDLQRKSNKQIHFLLEGEDTEIDRNMVEALSDPLVHLIRNAVDHGIESPGRRTVANKTTVGTITLRAYHAAGNVVIELSDDGCGLDREKILTKAAACGLVDPNREYTNAEIDGLIFHPGLSTATQVTDVSGRGVGMDVVKRSLEALRGTVEVTSEPGMGTTFVLRLPLTMAIIDAMVLGVGSERYLLPTVSVERCLRPEAGSVLTVAGHGEMVRHGDDLFPLIRLGRLFGVEGAIEDPLRSLLIIIEECDTRYAVMVDEVLGQQQAVIKPLGDALGNISGISGISGGAILGDGRVGLILDAAELLQFARQCGTSPIGELVIKGVNNV